MKTLKLILAIYILTSCSSRAPRLETEHVISPTTSLLQAISHVDEHTVWMSGHNGSFIRTNDAGKSWELFRHPTGDTLQFRDIYAFSEKKVALLSAGPGPLSRLFTFTAPDIWQENFVMKDSLGFLDCIDFWDETNGIAYGDAIDNYPFILLTKDGGVTWKRADTTMMPAAGSGEGGFAASGTCVTTAEDGKAWIATGAGGNCRFIATDDYGKSWSTIDSPLVRGEAAGNTSVSFVGSTGFVAGGDLMKPKEYGDNCAFSMDGGATWKLTKQTKTKGAFYGSSLVENNGKFFAFVSGPGGLDFTMDYGQNWTTLDTLNYWAVNLNGNAGYACGTGGKILKIEIH